MRWPCPTSPAAKTRPLVACLLLLCALTLAARADCLRLKNGTRLEGNILSETDTEIVLEKSFAGGTIRSKEIIRKSEVAEVIRATPEEKAALAMKEAYEAARHYQLDPQNSYTKDYYDRVLNGSFRKFLAEYPTSPYAAEMRERMAAWEAEREKVAAGWVKRNGQWLTPETVATNEAAALLQQARQALANNRFDLAAPLLDKVLAGPAPSNLFATAQQMRVKTYQDWLQSLQQSVAKLEALSASNAAAFATAKQRHDEAQNALRAAAQKAAGETRTQRLPQTQDQPEGGPKRPKDDGIRMGWVTDVVKEEFAQVAEAQKKLGELEREQVNLNAQMAGAKRVLAQVQTRMAELNIPAAIVAEPPPPPPPPTEEDLITRWGTLVKKYWLFGVIGLLAIIWMVARKLTD